MKVLATVSLVIAATVLAGGAATARTREGESELPPPVTVRQEPQGVTLLDPAFEPSPGARADFGRIGGAVYEIEIPDDWNGRLVLHMHGFGNLEGETSATPPDIRRYLIEHGYAWGASSFSSSSFIPNRAADETAALWDYFASKYGRPKRTYITGYSMGGLATHLAAERYGNRFDGALALCGSASIDEALRANAEFFAAGAYAAGLLQADFDRASDVAEFISDRIRPALEEPDAQRQFEDLMIDLTGGPRAFAREGFRIEEDTNWQRVAWTVGTGLATNSGVEYRLGPVSDVPSGHFNEFAIRVPENSQLRQSFDEGPDVTGNLAMPMLTMHTTGDGQVPIDQAQMLHRTVERAGKSDLLVQRVVRDPGHCGFRTTEQEAALEALVGWVEHDRKPAGTDVAVRDLRHLDRTFELAPRQAGIPGARERVIVHGRLTVDGEPFDAQFLGAVVVHDGLVSPCQHTLPQVRDGDYEISVSAEREVAGCGSKGGQIVLWTYVDDQELFTTQGMRWPGDGKRARFNATFSTDAPAGAAPPAVGFNGEVFTSDGRHLPAGTKIEGYIGDTLCGVGSTRYGGSYSGYILAIVGPDAVPGCTRGATITFRINGKPARETATNDLGHDDTVDLTLR